MFDNALILFRKVYPQVVSTNCKHTLKFANRDLELIHKLPSNFRLVKHPLQVWSWQAKLLGQSLCLLQSICGRQCGGLPAAPGWQVQEAMFSGELLSMMIAVYLDRGPQGSGLQGSEDLTGFRVTTAVILNWVTSSQDITLDFTCIFASIVSIDFFNILLWKSFTLWDMTIIIFNFWFHRILSILYFYNKPSLKVSIIDLFICSIQ